VLVALTPFCAVYYPVSVLPAVARPLALAIPAAHVFEGMRAVLANGTTAWGHLAWAGGLNVVWLGGAAVLFMVQFRAARRRGALLTIGE
jgi:ABC-2 type transport system permease protein